MNEMIKSKEELYDKCENMEQLYDNYYVDLQQENEQLKNNWNELKKWLEEFQEYICYNAGGEYFCKDENKEVKVQVVLDKMEELEILKGGSNE